MNKCLPNVLPKYRLAIASNQTASPQLCLIERANERSFRPQLQMPAGHNTKVAVAHLERVGRTRHETATYQCFIHSVICLIAFLLRRVATLYMAGGASTGKYSLYPYVAIPTIIGPSFP